MLLERFLIFFRVFKSADGGRYTRLDPQNFQAFFLMVMRKGD